MSNLVKWGEYSAETAVEEEKASQSGQGILKIKVGKSVYRVLPPKPGARSPFRVVWQHYIQVPGGDGVGFACPRSEAKKPCPVCTKADQLASTGNPVDFDAAKEMFAKRQVFCNVIDRGNPEAGPQVLRIGKTIHDGLIAIRKDEDAGGNFTHPIEGFDIIIERVGTGKNDSKYKVFAARQNSPLAATEQQMNDWIEVQANLERYAVVLTPEQIRDKIKAARKGEAPAPQAGQHREREVNAAPARTVAEDVLHTQPSEEDIPF